MSERATLRSGGIIGIAWVLIAFGAIFLGSGSRPTEFLELVASGLSLWWVVSLWSYMRSHESGSGGLSTLFLVGWTIALTVEVISYAIGAMQAARPQDSLAIGTYVNNSREFLNLASNIPLAAALIGAGLAMWVRHAFPRWIAALGLITGLAMFSLSLPLVVDLSLLTDTGVIFALTQLAFVIWLISVSIVMILKSSGALQKADGSATTV